MKPSIAEQIAAVRRIAFVIASDEDSEALAAVLATLSQHERAMAALREIADMEGAEITDSEFARKTLWIVTRALAALDTPETEKR